MPNEKYERDPQYPERMDQLSQRRTRDRANSSADQLINPWAIWLTEVKRQLRLQPTPAGRMVMFALAAGIFTRYTSPLALSLPF